MCTRRWLALFAGSAAAAVAIGCGEPGPLESTGPYAFPEPCPTDRVETYDARGVVGETEANAAAVLREHGCVLRVTVRDGRRVAGPQRAGDHRSVDVAVQDGRVTSVRPDGY